MNSKQDSITDPFVNAYSLRNNYVSGFDTFLGIRFVCILGLLSLVIVNNMELEDSIRSSMINVIGFMVYIIQFFIGVKRIKSLGFSVWRSVILILPTIGTIYLLYIIGKNGPGVNKTNT